MKSKIMKNDIREDLEAIATVASMYYQDDMSQQQIADILYYSRSKVSRMLKQAKKVGIVEVNVNYPIDRQRVLEVKIQEKFDVKRVIVVKNNDVSESRMLERVCNIGSKYVDEMIREKMVVGISWGTTIEYLIRSLKPHLKKQIQVVQLTGVVANAKNKNYDGTELVRALAQKYQGEFLSLPAPLYIQDEQTSQMLKETPLIQATLSKAKEADIIVTGISDFNVESQVVWTQLLSQEVKRKLVNKGAIGIFLSHFINHNGDVVDISLDNKIISMKLDELKDAKEVVTIANGKKKAIPVLAALRKGYITTLIIDDILANELLQKY